MEITEDELTALWRTVQVLHEFARIVRDGLVTEADLVFSYLSICECAEKVQALAARIQRKEVA